MNKRLKGYLNNLHKHLQADASAWIEVANDLANIKAYFEHNEEELTEMSGSHAGHYGWIKWTQENEPTLADYNPSWFQQTLSALEVHETVEVSGASPTIKHHCAVLSRVPRRKRNQVWRKALKAAKGKPVLLSHVVDAKQALLPAPEVKPKEPEDINDETRRAIAAVMEELKPLEAATAHADHLSAANRKWLRGQVSNAIAILTALDGALGDADRVIEPNKKLLN